MKIKLIVVGKCKEKFYKDACQEYIKRLSAYAQTEIIEVKDEALEEGTSEAEKEKVLDTEGKRILEKIAERDYVAALEIRGQAYDSMEFSSWLNTRMVNGESNLCFVIGGSSGLSPAVLQRADARLSFSKMTFPHQLMRVILLEQVYRAFRILNHAPYHK